MPAFKPKYKEAYFYLSYNMNVCSDYNLDLPSDDTLIEIGNCFESEADAAYVARQILDVLGNFHSLHDNYDSTANGEETLQTI